MKMGIFNADKEHWTLKNSLTCRTKNKLTIDDLFQSLDNKLKIQDNNKTCVAQLQQNPLSVVYLPQHRVQIRKKDAGGKVNLSHLTNQSSQKIL
jgi:hypothetical protein